MEGKNIKFNPEQCLSSSEQTAGKANERDGEIDRVLASINGLVLEKNRDRSIKCECFAFVTTP